MERSKIIDLVINEGLTIEDIIDTVIEINGIIGVGLISLGEHLNNYCKSNIKPAPGGTGQL